MNETDEGLSREIRKWDLVALLVNVTVGAGILRLPSDAQRAVGNYSLVAFVLCALVIGLIALCFAEVGSRFSGTGGPYLYGREAFGPAAGFMVGWLMWLTRLAGFATLTQVFVAYLSYFWPAAGSGHPELRSSPRWSSASRSLI
jgi:basic amino acid/polyamine antiporter, APA family